MTTSPRSVLAIDFGTQKIGIAIGQSITGTATALDTLPVRSGKPHWPNLIALIETWNPETIVVGLPLNMDGSESELSGKARQFARRLQAQVNQPVQLMDERLTSREARSLQYARHPNPRSRQPHQHSLHRVDAIAAKLIAESYLASLPST
ncbi:MAG: Holliday junction resolvase RuvX [Gammaproteobacteria bacterium]